MTLSTPGGKPARCASSASASAENGVASRRLDHDGAAGGERRRDLARDHRAREVPRRDRRADADRLLDHDEAPVVADGRDHVAVDALALPRRTTRCTRRRSSISPLRLGQRLALLGGEDQREVVDVGDHQLEPLAQDRAALLGGLRRATPATRASAASIARRVSAGAADRRGADRARRCAGLATVHRARRRRRRTSAPSM